LDVAAATPYPRLTLVPADAVRWPVFPSSPEGFVPERGATWPTGPGRYEYVAGRLEYMPPCGEIQQVVAADVVGTLLSWRATHNEFRVGGNEAGMLLEGDVRGADAAVWRVTTKPEPGFARVPPLLAVEVGGATDTLEYLENKAQWYLAHGVEVIWIVMADTRLIRVITSSGRVDVAPDGKLPEHPSLPGLAPDVRAFFQQL
jgi:Uma2 family endonuclease